MYHGEKLVFTRDASGRATQVEAAKVVMQRRKIDGENGETFQIKPVRPLAELRKQHWPRNRRRRRASSASRTWSIWPASTGLKLDIRYATDQQLPRHAVLHVREGVHAAAGRRGAGACNEKLKPPGLRPAHPRRLPAVVRHEDVLGRDAGEVPRLRRRPVEGFAAQPRLRGRSRSTT